MLISWHNYFCNLGNDHCVKRLFFTILALFYLTSTIGATIHQHYCMGELINSSLFNSNSDSCGKCGMEKHSDETKDCCKDLSIVIKTPDSHNFLEAVYDFNPPLIFLPAISLILLNLHEYSEEVDKVSHVYSPPLLKCPLFIQHCNFRI